MGTTLTAPSRPAKQIGKPIHGLCGTRLYTSWREARRRTTDPKSKSYHYYGGRGIRMAERYLNDPRALLEDIGPCPPDHTLDRIDFNRGYVPGNIRWADRRTQQNNQRTSVKYDYNGGCYTMAELSRLLGIPYHCLNRRIKILGWTVEKAVSTPKAPRGNTQTKRTRGRASGSSLSARASTATR